LLNAALRGKAAALEQFVVNPPLSQADVIASVEGWTAYRDNAPTFLRSAIENGSVRALYLGFFSAGTGLGPGGAVGVDAPMPGQPESSLIPILRASPIA